MPWKLFALVAVLLAPPVLAKNSGMKLKDVPTDSDTSIIIKKGATADQCVEYQVLDGVEEISGDPEYDKGEAMGSWKTACKEWKASMKEMNKGNQILTLHCNTPKTNKEDDRHTVVSSGTYKIKTKIRDKQ